MTRTGLAALRAPFPGIVTAKHGQTLVRCAHWAFPVPVLAKASFRRAGAKNARHIVSSVFVLCTGDSYRIQTCNLLIRSQMLYSVELTSQVRMRYIRQSLYKENYSSVFPENFFSRIRAFLPARLRR